MKKFLLFVTILLSFDTAVVSAQRIRSQKRNQIYADSVKIKWQLYADSLEMLLDKYRKADSIAATETRTITMNPYFFPLISTGTLYRAPLQQSMGISWLPSSLSSRKNAMLQSGGDEQLQALAGINMQLASMYARNPVLFQQTQEQVKHEGAMVADVEKPMSTDKRIMDEIQLADIEHDITDTIAAITRKPNFWTIKGNSSLQITQSHFSDNWFQGGENNYAALAMITLEANYDNKQKLQWDNRLELQLGFQTAPSDTCHTLKVTSNLLRLTSKLGYKAAKNWFYSTQLMSYTQLYPNFKTNTNEVTADFASPVYVQLAIGMDYKLKKNKFQGSLLLAPMSINMTYVDRAALRSRYIQEDDKNTKFTFGPNVTMTFNWNIWKNVQWNTRLYWFSDFKYTNIEWENTFTFTINKYLTSKLFLYPKFIDNNTKYRRENGSYWMFREWLSMGLSYSW